jgi:hypothetical protein
MISLSINVSKIDKARLFQGKQGQYLDAILIETPNSEYGDYMIVESISKEERDAGNKGTIIGNAKIINRRDPQQHNNPPDTTIDNPVVDDLPF